jgi:hypothetical protein
MKGFQAQCPTVIGTFDKSILNSKEYKAPGACRALVLTRGKSCKQYCKTQGLTCRYAQDNIGNSCKLDKRHSRKSLKENGCLQTWTNQMCACGPAAKAQASNKVCTTAPATKVAQAPCKTTLYQHGNFKGWKVVFNGVRDWRYRDYLKAGAKNDQVSAIKVEGKGCVATVYQHDIGGGWSANFEEGTYGMAAFLKKGAKNDDMSSLRVRRKALMTARVVTKCVPCEKGDKGCTHPLNANQKWCDARCTTGMNDKRCVASHCRCGESKVTTCTSTQKKNVCKKNEFDCGDNTCIPRGQLCDGVDQCKNGRDEVMKTCCDGDFAKYDANVCNPKTVFENTTLTGSEIFIKTVYFKWSSVTKLTQLKQKLT